MKILSVNKYYWMKGGSEAVFFGEKQLLESHGHQIIPFAMKMDQNFPSEYSEYFVNEVNYNHGNVIEKLNAALKIIYSVEARNKMTLLLKHYKPDLAHFHIFQHQIGPSVFEPLRKSNVPVLLTLHDLKPLCPNYKMYVNGRVCEKCKGRKFYHCFLNSCTKGSKGKSLVNVVEMYLHYALGYYKNVDKYIAVSHFHRDKMIEYGFPPTQIAYVPNCVDMKKHDYSGNDHGYAIMIGRLSYEKGVDTLIQAAKLSPEIPIKIIGAGPEEKKLRAMVVSGGIENVEFIGYKTGDELACLIANSSFTIIASIVYENCPMSILESFAMGKAVIGSDIGGIPELINEDVDGLLFKPGDAASLASKMKTLWTFPDKRKKMGEQGREKIERDFTPELHYERLMSVYASVIKEQGTLK